MLKTTVGHVRLFLLLLVVITDIHLVHAADSEPKIISTDTFLIMMESALNGACDNPGSPFACISRDISQCKKAIKITSKECLGELKDSFPDEIDLNNKKEVKTIFARCVMDSFIPAMGAENLNMQGCKK